MLRHFKILEHALSTVLRRKGKNAAILVVYIAVIATLGSILFLTESLKAEARRLLELAPDLVVQRTLAGRHDLVPTTWAEEIGTIRGVQRVRPRAWGYYYDALTEATYTLMDWDASGELPLLRGRAPTAPGECAVGSGVAGSRVLEPGDDLILVDSANVGRVFEVVGVFEPASRLLAHDLVVLPSADLAEFVALPAGRATDLVVEVHNPREIPTVAAKIKARLPAARPITHDELLRTYDAVFHWRSGMMLVTFLSVVAAFCILAWDKATGLSADEKREIGVLKAIGWDTADVLELKFWEGLVVSLVAFLAGLTLALGHVFLLGAPLLAPVVKGWSVLFPEFDLTPQVSIYQICVVGFLTVAPYVASTVIPAWKAAVTDPETVMRL